MIDKNYIWTQGYCLFNHFRSPIRVVIQVPLKSKLALNAVNNMSRPMGVNAMKGWKAILENLKILLRANLHTSCLNRIEIIRIGKENGFHWDILDFSWRSNMRDFQPKSQQNHFAKRDSATSLARVGLPYC